MHKGIIVIHWSTKNLLKKKVSFPPPAADRLAAPPRCMVGFLAGLILCGDCVGNHCFYE